MKITKRQLNKIIKEELSHVINEDDVGKPIFSQYHGGGDDSDTLDVIYDLAQEMALFTRALQSDLLRNQLQELIFTIMGKAQGD